MCVCLCGDKFNFDKTSIQIWRCGCGWSNLNTFIIMNAIIYFLFCYSYCYNLFFVYKYINRLKLKAFFVIVAAVNNFYNKIFHSKTCYFLIININIYLMFQSTKC